MVERVPVSVDGRRANLLGRLALDGGDSVAAAVAAIRVDDFNCLDDKMRALVEVAALIASPSAPASYQWAVTVALSAGALPDEIIDVLLSLAPIVGAARVTAAAPALASALGYEVDGDFCDPI